MADLCNQLKDNPQVVCLYFAAVLVLLVLIIMQLWQVGWFQSAAERYTPSQTGTTRSGSIVYATENSSTNTDNTNVWDKSFEGFSGEHLVNNRGEPDFWTIGGELGAYRRSQTKGMAQDAANQAEYLRGAKGMNERMVGSGTGASVGGAKGSFINTQRLERMGDRLVPVEDELAMLNAGLSGGSMYNKY